MKCDKISKNLQLIKVLVVIIGIFVLETPIPWTQNSNLAIAAPTISVNSPINGQVMTNSTILISGLTDPITNVDVFIDDILIGTTTSDDIGYWSLSASSLANGNHTLYAQAIDALGISSISGTISFQIDTIGPSVTIVNPKENAYYNSYTIEGQTEPNLRVSVFFNGKEGTVQADSVGNWSYTDNTAMEGSQTVYATATDEAGNVGTSLTHNFTLDTIRPIISPILSPPEDMTRVASDSIIKMNIIDDSPIDTAILQDAFKVVSSNGTEVTGTVIYNSIIKEISFTPAANFQPNTMYFVYVNPSLTDLAGNFIYARNWSFLTMGISGTDNPHGNYTDNVNTCINCHSTHTATGERLDDPKYPNNQTLDNYCNACHDGTFAPIPENWLKNNKHSYQIAVVGTSGAGACVSCHNPHLTWSKDNPNLLQDGYFYTHNDPTNPYLPNSSDEQLCESCHPNTIKDDTRVKYEIYQYKKKNSTSGAADDNKLCLRCHNGKTASDISTFYNLTTGHIINSKDGSPLIGHLPCADCHTTHGSDNIKILNTDIGHKNSEKFIATGSTWDVDTERQFCTRCHNNNTEVYGVVATINLGISGHEASSTVYCNKCHGGDSPVRAAHAPMMPLP